MKKKTNLIFNNLFVLELANNHLGSVKRGLKIINDHAQIVRYNNIKAAIKLQFRDIDNFVHHEFKSLDERYVKKTLSTKITKNDFKILVDQIKKVGCIPMATPFDENSVDLCKFFDFPIIKIASSDTNDWPLIEKIVNTRKPVIISSGGTSEKDLDDIVNFFNKRDIDLAINHCVSLYPSEDNELCLNEIDYLKERYPDNVIGFSTHEYHDWSSSILISYAKGARTWERHIDIQDDNIPVSKYCSKPDQTDDWFKSFYKAIEMCGPKSNQRRNISKKEIDYLNKLVRGIFAKKNLPEGYVFDSKNFNKDFYLAIPLLRGQLSCREILNGEMLKKPILKDKPLLINDIKGPYSENIKLKKIIENRGLKLKN